MLLNDEALNLSMNVIKVSFMIILQIKCNKTYKNKGGIMDNEKFTSITQKKGKQVYIPNILLEAANIKDDDSIWIENMKMWFLQF